MKVGWQVYVKGAIVGIGVVVSIIMFIVGVVRLILITHQWIGATFGAHAEKVWVGVVFALIGGVVGALFAGDRARTRLKALDKVVTGGSE